MISINLTTASLLHIYDILENYCCLFLVCKNLIRRHCCPYVVRTCCLSIVGRKPTAASLMSAYSLHKTYCCVLAVRPFKRRAKEILVFDVNVVLSVSDLLDICSEDGVFAIEAFVEVKSGLENENGK